MPANRSELFELQALLADARQGGGLNALLEKLRPYLKRATANMIPEDLRCKLSSSDLMQQSLLEAAQSFEAFAGCSAGELLAWSYAILRHNALGEIQRYRASKRDASREGGLREHHADGRSSDPVQEAIYREMFARRMDALARLSDNYRRVIELHLMFGLSYADCAEELKINEVAVRQLYSRALVAWQKEDGPP